MISIFPHRSADRPPSEVAYTIRSVLSTQGQSFEQMQYATDRYVVTVIGPTTLLYSREHGERFLVDRGRRQLRPLDPAKHRKQVEEIRGLIGQLATEEDAGETMIEGRRCRCVRLRNHDARLVLSVETYSTRIPGIEATALDEERRFDAPYLPFFTPLEPDAVLVRSTTRILSTGFSQNQTVQLAGIDSTILDLELFDGFLDFSIIRP